MIQTYIRKLEQEKLVSSITGGGSSEARLLNIGDLIDEMKNEINKQITEVQKNMLNSEKHIGEQIQTLREAMKQKISIQDLQSLDERLQSLIDKVVSNINKRFMDR